MYNKSNLYMIQEISSFDTNRYIVFQVPQRYKS